VRIRSVGAWIAAAALARSAPARATTGGPLTVEVLGWSPADERIYVRQTGHDESGGERDCVFYFDLRSHDPARPWVVHASLQRWSPDAAETAGFERERARLEAFLRGLQPLERADEGREGLLRSASVEADTTIALTRDAVPTHRYTLRIDDRIRATAWWTPCVSALGRYKVPGRETEVMVMSFIGDPFEGGYEVQRCVITGLPNLGEQILDSPNGVLPWPLVH
jgi:hypothetical protein